MRQILRQRRDHLALAVRALGGVDQLLHAVARREIRLRAAAFFDRVEEALGEPRHRRDAAVRLADVGRVLDRDARERRRPALGVKQFEAAHVVGFRIVQHQRAVLAVELQPVPRPEKRRAAHRQAHRLSAGEHQRHRRGGLQAVVVRQAGEPRRQLRNRPVEPFEIMEAVRDEIAEHAAAVVGQRLPVAHAHLDRAVLHLPMHRDMPQPPDRAVVEHLLGALPGDDLGEIEIEHRRFGRALGGAQHGARVGQGARHRLLAEHRLAERQRGDSDPRLQAPAWWRSPPRPHSCPRPARASRRSPSPRRPRARARPRAWRRCRPAPPPRNGCPCGTPAIARCVRNWCRRCLRRITCPRSPEKQWVFPRAAWIWAKSTC